MTKKITFKAESFRRIPNPYDQSDSSMAQMYSAICDVKNVPDELLQWMDTNPRKQNINGRVGKNIKNSLLTGDNFHLLNRGILLSAESVRYDNIKNLISVSFSDPEVHGDVDGGHTLRVIIDNKDELDYGRQYVKFEILTGVENFFEDLAEARNTSTQVKNESIANLKDYYKMLKEVIATEPYFDNINYMENDDGDIEIGEILAILNMFDLDAYPSLDDTPIISYSSKKKCIDKYSDIYDKVESGEILETDNPYFKMLPVLVDIFKLHDKLECNIANYYQAKTPGGHYGSTTGVTVAKDGKTFSSKFYKNTMTHSTPKGFLYPILGAFRALLEEKDGVYCWTADPFELMDAIGPELVTMTVERSRNNGNNPNKTGKDKTLWAPLYMRVMMAKMMVK